MENLTFYQKFYIAGGVIKRIDSQHKFIGELFFACGSEFFPKNMKKNEEGYWTARSLFSGRRKFSTEMKESFPLKINEEKFVAYFKDRINEKSLHRIAENFLTDISELDKELFLKALCRQFEAIIYDESDEDIVNKEYMNLKEKRTSSDFNSVDRKLRSESSVIKSPVRLWLPDAELATEEQSGFESFTPTASSGAFMDPDSYIWGIRSAKGVGKTYLLQKMRRDMNKFAIPQYHKLSKDNEWGTESVRFDDPTLLEKADIKQLAGLWKVSILCLVINCIESHISRKDITTMVLRGNLPSNIVYILEKNELHDRLNEIINGILLDNNWRSTILKSYTVLRAVCKQVLNKRIENIEYPVVVFIDKVDQSILQPGAEIPECNNCYKDTKYDDCEEKNKGRRYCLEQCRGCCFGCEKFSSQYAGEELRIYGSKYGKRYEHISQWQHLQLALVIAVDSIRLDFSSKIQVYYAIRQEAFNAEENLLGANAPKIKAHTEVLHYSKNEQEEIFNNTIKIQHSDYLFNPNLIEKGNYAEAFVGISRLCHPHVTGKDESLFECIYRHSLDRAREIQYIGDALALRIPEIKQMKSQEERAELVKRIIETTAANLLFITSGTCVSGNRTYYNDKQILLRNYWANPDNFKNFIQKIDKNLLFMEDLADICKKVNNYPECDKKCEISNCELHPFSMLYQIGLLGRASYNSSINKDSEQIFIASRDITYYRNEAEIFPNDETLFILHPALTKCIEINIRGASIKHFRGFILGNGLPIPRDKHKELLENKKKMDSESFEAMYYTKSS